MPIQPTIQTIPSKKLIGKQMLMTFAEDNTFNLWRSFMPRRKEIKNNLSNDLISMQVYPRAFDFTFANLNVQFQKWAAIEVADFNEVPKDMETFILPAGLYAVFHYKGLSTDTTIFHYIFATWLPASEYAIDNRPHFQILGEKYKNNDPSSEEEICIPIRLR
jgi:AraC family transcriptional regulator